MADETEYPRRGYDTEDVEAMRAEAPRRRRRWGLIALLSVIVGPLVVFALWAWVTLSYSYSSGQRAGYVQKFSDKGWICKTWEGELALVNLPGAMPEIFYFTVRDDRVVAEIQEHIGNRVALTYDEHRGVPSSCFGETQYFVTGVRVLDQGGAPAAGPPATVPPASAPAIPPPR
jgi:hypothetical protein